MAHQGYDDEELSISLAPSNNRRSQNKAPDAAGPSRPREERAVEPTPQKSEQRIGAYQIIRTLGEGSFGKVKLAIHRITQQKVALKIIARKKLISRDMAGRVEREIEYLQLLRHPHIIKLYTVIKTSQEIIMVLEYAGGELFDYIVQHGKMKEDAARRFFQQIICAVEYCHRHKIVHRDLKPENLLLDENLNVKIADFGLSNIMTDGNFLKTSCGSPNYAAPEVINGKLYAGPEVDVWSCGVILYVLLVGRLPFDDEHIPSLFAKIAKGHYVVPSYMSHGASTLIKKMLAVNPVHRATIEEIRQDPWFLIDLAPYLKPPVEEFFDTGVDPSKAINIRSIAPGASLAVQKKLHDDITDKIGRTMGYGKRDVIEALEAEEPSVIKDAYLIVREHKLMEALPDLTDNPFITASPPVHVDSRGITPANPSSPLGPAPAKLPGTPDNSALAKELSLSLKSEARSPGARSEMTTTSMSTDRSARPYISKVGILPSSLTAYHQDYMAARENGKDISTSPPQIDHDNYHDHAQSAAEQEENLRRIKPHSRSHSKLNDLSSTTPAIMTPVPVKRTKPTKWQFGIRSRNQPLEAIGCIYRALKKLNAEWVLDEKWRPKVEGGKHGEGNGSFDIHDSDDDGGSLHHTDSMVQEGDSSKDLRFEARHPNAKYKLPADPWVLQVKWRKGDMYPPGINPPSSTQSSQVDLRRHSLASLSSAGGSMPSHDGVGTPASDKGSMAASDNVVMHLDIQLYEMEPGVFLVDFKCAGYETPEGALLEDKDVTSPFPFLDLASKLIVQLAEAD